MSTTKYQLAEQALRILSGGDVSKDSETDIRELMIAVSQARDKIVRMELFQMIAAGEYDINSEYLVTYESVAVSKDMAKNLFYSILPAKVITLPKGMGVYQISLMQDQYNAFAPLPANFMSMYRNLPSQGLEGRFGYWQEGARVYYTGVDSVETPTVLMKLVPASNEVGEDDVFPIPPDKEYDVVSMAIQMYATQKGIRNDQINDNVDSK